MTCRACELRLEEYLEGGVDRYTAMRIERHLVDCGSCRATLDELRSMERLLNTASRAAALEPAPNFTFAVMAEVRAMPLPRVQPVMRWAFLGWYLLGAWALIGILALFARPLLLNAIAALGYAAAGTLSVVQAIVGAVSAATDGHGAAIVVIVMLVLAVDTVLAAGVYLAHTVVRPRIAAHLTVPVSLEQA